jgi:hypothetical protein
MEDSSIPILTDCVSIMAHLREKYVHKLFFTYDATCPDFPHAFFDAHPDIQSLSDVEPKLLKSVDKTPQQFYQEVTAIFDMLLSGLQTSNRRADSPGLGLPNTRRHLFECVEERQPHWEESRQTEDWNKTPRGSTIRWEGCLMAVR